MTPLAFPNNIQIQTTSYCNAKCSFCPYPETSRELPMGHMDEDLFRSIIDQITEHEVSLVQPFLMNDPLMDKRLIPRLAYMKERLQGPRINITTNGALMRPDIARELAALDLDSIHVSSNGITAAVHRHTMGVNAATVLRNVNVLADALRSRGARTTLIVTALLLEATREEVFIARDYWRARGIEFFVNPLNDRAGNIPYERFDDMLPFDAELNRSQLLSYDMSGCPALYSFMGILYNGDLVTCCMDWRRSLVLGNVRDKSLQSLWHDGPYGEIRGLSDSGRLADRPLCRKCGKNRFSIDAEALQDLIDSQEDPTLKERNARVASKLDGICADDKDSLKMNLIRPG